MFITLFIYLPCFHQFIKVLFKLMQLNFICVVTFWCREVEDFARRLNSDWPERMQEFLTSGQERNTMLFSTHGTGFLRRHACMLLLYVSVLSVMLSSWTICVKTFIFLLFPFLFSITEKFGWITDICVFVLHLHFGLLVLTFFQFLHLLFSKMCFLMLCTPLSYTWCMLS